MTTHPTKAVPLPGYTALKPQYPAVRQFYKVAGLHDNIINLGELALRYFERDMYDSGDQNGFVDSLSRSLGVNTSLGIEWDKVRSHAHKYVIAQMISMIDAFVRQLSYEFKAYKQIPEGTWKTQAKGGQQLDLLAALTENFTPALKTRIRQYPEYELVHYYRSVRNRLIHGTKADTDNQLKTLLRSHKTHFNTSYKSLPSSYNDIGYDDYFLLTRAIKYFSKILNDACNLKPSEIVDYLMKSSEFVAKMRLAKGSLARTAQLIKHLSTLYALPDADANEFRRLLLEFRQNDPPKKVRRKALRRR